MDKAKFWTVLALGIGLITTFFGAASASGPEKLSSRFPPVKVVVGGEQLGFADGTPYHDLNSGQVYLPLRRVLTALGAEVGWQQETAAAVVKHGGRIIVMPANGSMPQVDGSPGPNLGFPARLEGGRLMVPSGFVSEVLGCGTEWKEGESTLKIEAPAVAEPEPGAITITERSVQATAEEAEVNMRIPMISGLQDQVLEEEINARFMQKAEDFRREIIEPYAEYKASMEQYGGPVHPFQVFVDYDVHYNLNGLLSISVSYYGFQGGAHGFTVRETLNLDVNTGKVLTLGDFFGQDENYKDIVSRKILEQIAASPEMYFEEAPDTVAKITGDQPFYIGDGQIVIYFAQYEIAPYAAGMPEFAVPLPHMPGMNSLLHN